MTGGPSGSPGFLLWRATLAWQRAVVAALKDFSLTHVQFVLLAGAWWLAERGGPPTQRELADHAGTDPMMTSQVLRALEARGLVERVADAADSRAKRVSVTADGADLARRAIPAVEAADAGFFAPVGKSDAVAFLAALAAAPQGTEDAWTDTA